MSRPLFQMFLLILAISGLIALANKQTTAYFLRSLAIDGDDEVTETSI